MYPALSAGVIIFKNVSPLLVLEGGAARVIHLHQDALHAALHHVVHVNKK